MKRSFPFVLLLLLSLPVYAQETVSIATFLKIKGADKTAYSVKGVLAETIRQEELVFLLRDDSGDLVFKLSDDGPEAAMAFRSSEIVPGDTLTISGMRKRIFMKGEKTRVGMYPGTVVNQMEGPNHAALAANWSPSFRGRGKAYFSEWVNRHLKYPPESKKRNSQGPVDLTFVVNEDGSVSDIIVVHSSGDSLLDAEAVRVVSSSPRWFPAIVENEPIKATFNFTVIFAL